MKSCLPETCARPESVAHVLERVRARARLGSDVDCEEEGLVWLGFKGLGGYGSCYSIASRRLGC